MTADSSTEIPDRGHRRPRSGKPLRYGTDVAAPPLDPVRASRRSQNVS
jgi:hypothetical protein